MLLKRCAGKAAQASVCEPRIFAAPLPSCHTAAQLSARLHSSSGSSSSNRATPVVVCRSASAEAEPKRAAAWAAAQNSAGELTPVPSTAEGKLISKTEVAAFIQRDDMMDQMYRWALMEAGEGGIRNFGLPMNVVPFYAPISGSTVLWGFKIGIFKEGVKLCDLGIMFDQEVVPKHEWVGRGDDGFPVLEGKVEEIIGKNFEIWKLDSNPVDETLRSTIRAFCNGLVTGLNRYYAFGSVFVDDAQ